MDLTNPNSYYGDSGSFTTPTVLESVQSTHFPADATADATMPAGSGFNEIIETDLDSMYLWIPRRVQLKPDEPQAPRASPATVSDGKWHHRKLKAIMAPADLRGTLRIFKPSGKSRYEIQFEDIDAASKYIIEAGQPLEHTENENGPEFVHGSVGLRVTTIKGLVLNMAFPSIHVRDRWHERLNNAVCKHEAYATFEATELNNAAADSNRLSQEIARLSAARPDPKSFITSFLAGGAAVNAEADASKGLRLEAPPNGGRLSIKAGGKLQIWEIEADTKEKGVVYFRKLSDRLLQKPLQKVVSALPASIRREHYGRRVYLPHCTIRITKPFSGLMILEMRLDGGQGKVQRLDLMSDTLEVRVKWQEWFQFVGATIKDESLRRDDSVRDMGHTDQVFEDNDSMGTSLGTEHFTSSLRNVSFNSLGMTSFKKKDNSSSSPERRKVEFSDAADSSETIADESKSNPTSPMTRRSSPPRRAGRDFDGAVSDLSDEDDSKIISFRKRSMPPPGPKKASSTLSSASPKRGESLGSFQREETPKQTTKVESADDEAMSPADRRASSKVIASGSRGRSGELTVSTPDVHMPSTFSLPGVDSLLEDREERSSVSVRPLSTKPQRAASPLNDRQSGSPKRVVVKSPAPEAPVQVSVHEPRSATPKGASSMRSSPARGESLASGSISAVRSQPTDSMSPHPPPLALQDTTVGTRSAIFTAQSEEPPTPSPIARPKSMSVQPSQDTSRAASSPPRTVDDEFFGTRVQSVLFEKGSLARRSASASPMGQSQRSTRSGEEEEDYSSPREPQSSIALSLEDSRTPSHRFELKSQRIADGKGDDGIFSVNVNRHQQPLEAVQQGSARELPKAQSPRRSELVDRLLQEQRNSPTLRDSLNRTTSFGEAARNFSFGFKGIFTDVSSDAPSGDDSLLPAHLKNFSSTLQSRNLVKTQSSRTPYDPSRRWKSVNGSFRADSTLSFSPAASTIPSETPASEREPLHAFDDQRSEDASPAAERDAPRRHRSDSAFHDDESEPEELDAANRNEGFAQQSNRSSSVHEIGVFFCPLCGLDKAVARTCGKSGRKHVITASNIEEAVMKKRKATINERIGGSSLTSSASNALGIDPRNTSDDMSPLSRARSRLEEDLRRYGPKAQAAAAIAEDTLQHQPRRDSISSFGSW